jgi:hypothetical protein
MFKRFTYNCCSHIEAYYEFLLSFHIKLFFNSIIFSIDAILTRESFLRFFISLCVTTPCHSYHLSFYFLPPQYLRKVLVLDPGFTFKIPFSHAIMRNEI